MGVADPISDYIPSHDAETRRCAAETVARYVDDPDGIRTVLQMLGLYPPQSRKKP